MKRPAIPPRVKNLIPLLGSPSDGEALNTRDAIVRALGAVGLGLTDLAEAITVSTPGGDAPSFFDMARACRDLDCGRLSPTEKRFIGDMLRLGTKPPSERQAAWLADLFARLTRRAA